MSSQAAKVDVTAKLRTVVAKINALPPARKKTMRARLDALEAKAGTPKVAGTSRPGSVPTSKPKPAVKKTSTGTALALVKSPKPVIEWDLVFANELDKIYTAVSDRATEVRKDVVNATGQTASDLAAPVAKLGFGLWPLAIAALAIAWAYSQARAPRGAR